jgi:hypothetical protein
MERYNKTLERNKLPCGQLISQLKRYIQIAISSGNLNMPVYESKLVNLNKGGK